MQQQTHTEDVEVRGHIIDSLILPKILDIITSGGGSFRIKNISIGQARTDPSHTVVPIGADSEEQLNDGPTHGSPPRVSRLLRVVIQRALWPELTSRGSRVSRGVGQ